MGTMAGRLRRLGRIGGLGLWLALVAFVAPAYAQSDIVVALDAPQPGAQVQGDLDLVGTVRGAGLQRYELHYRPVGTEQEFIYFDGDQIQIEGGVLGRWSTGGLAPGAYEIRLQAFFGEQPAVGTTVNVVLDPDGTGAAAPAEPETAGATEPLALQTDTSLRQALDQLALRARPVALWAYMQRGMRWSGGIVLAVLAYFALKTLALYLVRWLRQR